MSDSFLPDRKSIPAAIGYPWLPGHSMYPKRATAWNARGRLISTVRPTCKGLLAGADVVEGLSGTGDNIVMASVGGAAQGGP